MKQLNNILAAAAGLLLFAGCATTIDLYDYKDVSSINIIDENKASYQVLRPNLDPNIYSRDEVSDSFHDVMEDAFFVSNNRLKIFTIDKNNAYKLRLKLRNLESTSKYHPSEYVQDKKGGYYTNPYWSYTVATAINTELISPKGEKYFYEASDKLGYSLDGEIKLPILNEKKRLSIQNSIDKLIRQIANQVSPEGLIVSKKVSLKDPQAFIYMVNMGLENGLHPDQKVNVYKEVINKNEIDAKTLSNKIYIGSARVSNQVSATQAWIVMEDSEHNKRIEAGDIIRAVY